MDTASLKAWAAAHADGPVEDHPDPKLHLRSRLLRFRWNGGMAVGVGSEAGGKERINAVLDGVSWFLERANDTDGCIHLVLGLPAETAAVDLTFQEHLGAIATLTAALRGGPDVHVWSASPGHEPVRLTMAPPAFTTPTPARWNAMLMSAANAPISGMAAEIVGRVHHPSFALYPKLTGQKSPQPWQMRLDGLEIGRTGAAATTLGLASTNIGAPGEPRDTWRTIVGERPMVFGAGSSAEVVHLVDQLVAAWTDGDNPAAVLRHGQAEHALEAHVLSGRLQLPAASRLRPAVPFRSKMLGAAQFPTLWGDVTRPARYLDALLVDEDQRPCAVELKDQAAGGGHGAYLRHGIGQAVLYRHFIRSADALDPWFDVHGLRRTACRAALAFPVAVAAAAKTIERHRKLARLYDVEVIEFLRPGGAPGSGVPPS